ncbi:MAG: relaxase [Alphaproteobacteria bacterium]
MILEGNQRGGARQMARHLMNTQDNEHVEIHEISGFLSDTVMGALQEIQAIAKGTKCKQFMFSVSLNPPHNENVPINYFENALSRIEEENGLQGQPRVVVFHEKEGRRHAHCIWSRIDAESMTAINLPHYKRKLCDLSKDLFLQYDWELPQGFIDREHRNPLNMSRAEWQQAKRTKQDPRLLKQLLKRAWEVSDNRAAFEHALREHGFWLARGDRRGFVAVDYKGEIYSLSRWAGVKPKHLKARFGEPENLPSVEEVKAEIAQVMTQKLQAHIDKIENRFKKDIRPVKLAVQNIKDQHQSERKSLSEKQAQRWQQEEQQRMNRLPHGLMGLWHRITGKYYKITTRNEQETKVCLTRDRAEKQALIDKQLKQRQRLQIHIQNMRDKHNRMAFDLRRDIALYQEMGELAIQENHTYKNEIRL